MLLLPSLLLVSTLGGWLTGQAQETVIDQPSAFAIEIPSLQTGIRRAVDGPDLHLPAGVVVSRFRVWLLEPYAQRIEYSGLTASLNGQSLATLRRGSRRDGKFLEIDLTLRPDLIIRGGKAAVEVQAREITDQEAGSRMVYRTLFLLLIGSHGGGGNERNPLSITCRSVPAPVDPNLPPTDSIVPRLEMEEPSQPIDGTAPGALQVRIRGRAIDPGGDPLVLLVNGAAVNRPREVPRSSRRSGEQKKGNPVSVETVLPFDQLAEIPETASAIVVEVRDPNNNRSFCNIPIRRPQVASQTGFAGRKYAVLVGVSRYDSQERNLTSLQYADRDAEALSAWLRTPGGGAFRAEDIVLLTNEQATLAAVRQAIDRFLTAAGPDDLIYLFLAGHGGPDPYDHENYYFLLHDSKVATLDTSAYPMRELGDFLRRKSKGGRLISFLDTCHSAQISTQAKSISTGPAQGRSRGAARGGVTNRGVGQRPRPPGSEPGSAGSPSPPSTTSFSFDTSNLFRQRGWSVITSAGADEKAQESSRWGGGHGVFTWSLLQALRDGKGDLDRDCQVTAAELRDYLRREVVAQPDGQQTPRVLGENVDQLVLATLPGCRK